MRILVFDSGVGGLSVHRELRRALPQARFFYAADDAAFPYGAFAPDDLVWRVLAVLRRLVARVAPQGIVVACNTASTLVLPHLRAAFPDIPIVGTVPAIKPAAAATRSGLVSVLATPGTVARDYTRELIATFAADKSVTLVGSTRLAGLAEDCLRGRPVDEAAVAREIAPCFVTRDGAGAGAAGADPARTDVERTDTARTDVITLSCTHYPFLLDHFRALAPWPVQWIDPAPAIARRAAAVIPANLAPPSRENGADLALFTSGRAPEPALAQALAGFGLIFEPDFSMPL